MRYAIILQSALLTASLLASPFAPEPVVECVVYSDSSSDRPLHVRQTPSNIWQCARQFDFPSSYTGHRAVCRLPGSWTNDVLHAWIGGDRYVPGDPFGTSKLRPHPSIEVTRSSPVFARVDLYGDGKTDRMMLYGNDGGDVYGRTVTNITDAIWCSASNDTEHVRVVPYMVAGTMFEGNSLDRSLWGRRFVQLDNLVTNRVVAEFDVNKTLKPMITEQDFVGKGVFDIDWDGFVTEILNNGNVVEAVGDVTAVKYRLVFGREGPLGRESALDTNTQVRVFETLIERRFESAEERTVPTELSTADVIVRSARPTFRWRLDERREVDMYAASSALFGCSYTAFQLQVTDASDTGFTNVVYDSGIRRAPTRNGKGEFEWTPLLSAGDQMANGNVFAQAGNWRWRVAMYNAKFKPSVRAGSNGWSAAGTFSTAEPQSNEREIP